MTTEEKAKKAEEEAKQGDEKEKKEKSIKDSIRDFKPKIIFGKSLSTVTVQQFLSFID